MPFILTNDTLISDISKNCPKALEFLTEYGLNCANCFLNTFDTVEAGARIHGMTDEEIKTMILEINAEITKDFT
jgi:uncharacterized radical SAM superfamily Fe-S cluster-containing enzyme